MSRALTRHRERFEADPGDPQAFELLEEHLSRASDWAGLCEIYQQHLTATDGVLPAEQRARLLFRQAQAAQRCGGPDADAEVADALGEAVSLDPDFAPALRELQRLSGETEPEPTPAAEAEPTGAGADASGELDLDGADDALEEAAPALETDADDLGWVELLEQQAAEPGLDATERIELLVQIGRVQRDRLDDPEAACDAYQMALTLDPLAPAPLQELEQILRKLEHFDELERLLLQAAEAEPDSPERWCALGEVRAGERGDPAGAVAAFERALAIRKDLPRARAGMLAAARNGGDETAQARALAFEATECDATRLPELVRSLVERADAEVALPAAKRWVELAPDSLDALQMLARLQGDLGHTDELVETLERIDPALEGVERAANQRRLGYLHAAEGRGEAALAAWRAAVESDPDDIASLEAILQALAGDDRAVEALEVLEAHQQRGRRAAEPRSLALHRARALEGAGRMDEALTLYRELHRSWAGVPEVLEGFERIARVVGDDETLAECLQERLSATSDPAARAALQFERAVLLEERLARSLEACALYAALVEDAPDATVACQAEPRLEALLERSGDFVALRDHLERRLPQTPLEDRPSLHVRVAELSSGLGDAESARQHLRRALDIEPDRTELWERLAGLLDEERDAPELLEVLEAELAADPSPRDEPLLRGRAARLADAVGDGERAEGHFTRLAELEPGHPEALAFLAPRLEARGAWADRAALLEAAIEAGAEGDADVETGVALRLQLAEVLSDRLERSDEAAELLEWVCDATPDDARAFLRLFEIYRSRERVDELRPLCARAAGAASSAAERANWWMRLIDVVRASDPEAAIDACRKALDEQPGRASAREALRELLRETGDTAGLVEVLEQDLRDGDNRALRGEVADLLEGPLDRPQDALPHLQRALEIEPGDGELRFRAIALAERTGHLDVALDLLLSGLEDPLWANRADLWRQAADWLAGPMERPADAIEAYQKCVQLDGSNPAPERALRCLLEDAGRWEEALALLEREAERCDPADRLGWLAEGADCARAHLSARALRPWLERMVPLASDDPEMLGAIADALARSGFWAAAERTLARATEASADAAERFALYRERARILEYELGEPARALALLEEAHALDPRVPSLWVDLDRLCRTSGRWRLLAEVLELRARRATGAQRCALLARAAECTGERLGELDRAATLWTEALSGAAPTERSRWLSRATDALRAAGRMRDWAPLAEEEVSRPISADRAVALRRELMELWAGPLAAPERALPHARALADAAGVEADPARETLFALLRITGRTTELARRLGEHLERAPAGAAQWLELGRLREEQLADLAGASAAYRAAVDADAGCTAALTGLRRCCERLACWREVVELLEREIDAGIVEPAAGWLRAGEILWRELDERDDAAEAFERAQALDPASLGALRGLQDTTAAGQEWHVLRQLFRAELELLGEREPERRRELWLELAMLASGPTPNDERAAEAFEAAASLGALELEQQAAWAARLERLGATDRWIEVFGAWCDAEDSPAGADDHLRLARALARNGEPEPARMRLARVLERAPGYVRGWETSAELCEQIDDPAGAIEAWSRAGERSEGAAAAEFFVRAAALLGPGDEECAAALLERALESDPASVEALARNACVAAALGQAERCTGSASRLLSLAGRAELLPPELRRAAWTHGARCACEAEQWAAAAALAAAVLAEDETQPEALAAAGVAAFHLDDPETCQARLAARLAQPASGAERAEWLSMRGAALEVGAHWEASLACHAEALDLDGRLQRGHAGRARCLERLGRTDQAAEALAAWARCGGEGAADRWLRAARLHGAGGAAEGWLREALEAERDHGAAHLDLARALWADDRHDEAFEIATQGAERVRDPAVVSALETLRGRVFEQRNDLTSALDSYQRAAGLDLDACEAALAAGRLLSRGGQWREAADLLGSFAERHRDPGGCAELEVQRARLLAGVLEDLEGAETAYRRACELAPERRDARDALGNLLAHLPNRGHDAASVHRQILAETPQRGASIRALTRIAEREGDADRARRGATLLRALGVATRSEREAADPAIDFAVEPRAPGPGEEYRQALLKAAKILEDLGEVPESSTPQTSSAVAEAVRETEAELFGATAWLHCPPERVDSMLSMLAEVAAGSALPETPAGRVACALDKGGVRRLRRILGKAGPDVVTGFDVVRWQIEGRARAAARAVDRLSGALRPVLLALLGAEALEADVEIETRIADCPEAQLLLTRALEAWLES